jgi:nucleotide-binding universal stress UspA family protein
MEEVTAESIQRVISAVVKDAKDAPRFGTAQAITAALRKAGITGRGGGEYSDSTVSNWINSQAMPPSDVFLALAVMAGISVDEALRRQTLSERIAQIEAADAERDHQVEALRQEGEALRQELEAVRRDMQQGPPQV